MRKLTNGTFSEDLALLMLMYGATDMGKTTQLSQIAKWYANHAPAKKISMLTADSGTGPLQEEIANGQIEVLSLRRYHAPFGLLQRVVGMGYWNVEDDGIEPVTGKVKWKARPTADFEWDNVGGYFIEGTNGGQFTSLTVMAMGTLSRCRKTCTSRIATWPRSFRTCSENSWDMLRQKRSGASTGTNLSKISLPS